MQFRAQPQIKHDEAHDLWQFMLLSIKEQHLDRSVIPTLLWKLPLLTLALAGCVYQAWTVDSNGMAAMLCLGLAFIIAQFAFLGHDAGHGSIHQVCGHFCMTVVTGLCFEEWYQRHRTHHQFCQFEAKDPDMAVDLVVSLTAASRARKNALGRFLTRWQGISIWFLAFLFAQSQRHLSQWGALRAPRRFAKDLLMLALHFSAWWLLPLLVFDIAPARILLVYALPLIFLGPYLAAIFWVNHVGMPLVDRPQEFSFLEHQVMTSRTILNPRAFDWFFGGLNYQIEHHLFPQIPSTRLRRVQSIVRPTLMESGIPYQGVGFGRAVRAISAHFRAIAMGLDG